MSNEPLQRIRRGRYREKYSALPNAIPEDARLSCKEVGLLWRFLSKPPDWIIHLSQFAATGTDGIAAIKSRMKKLRKLGYVSLVAVRSPDGKQVLRWEYLVCASPGDTAASYLIVVLDAVYKWGISPIAITSLVIETPMQFIGLLFIIARNLFPQSSRLTLPLSLNAERAQISPGQKKRRIAEEQQQQPTTGQQTGELVVEGAPAEN